MSELNLNDNSKFKSSISKTREHFNSGGRSVHFSSKSIFTIVIFALFVVFFSRYIRTGSLIGFKFSFQSLLDYLRSMPQVDMFFNSIQLTIDVDWGIFNFLRNFINFFGTTAEFTLTLTGMVSQAFLIIFYIVRLLFI